MIQNIISYIKKLSDTSTILQRFKRLQKELTWFQRFKNIISQIFQKKLKDFTNISKYFTKISERFVRVFTDSADFKIFRSFHKDFREFTNTSNKKLSNFEGSMADEELKSGK